MCLPARPAACRQAPEGSPAGRAVFSRRPGLGVSMNEVGLSMGPDALARPGGPLPADPADDANLPAELQALKPEAERRLAEWATTGQRPGVVVAVRRVRMVLDRPRRSRTPTTRRSPASSPAATTTLVRHACTSTPTSTSTTPTKRLAPDAESIFVLANPVQPHSEGEIVLASADPDRASRHPHELLRRPVRHEGDDRGAAPGARHRRALARATARSARCWSRRSSPRSTAT